MRDTLPKPLAVIVVEPPPAEQRVQRNAEPTPPGHKRSRYSLPMRLDSHSVVGYRTRIPLTVEEAREAMPLLSMARPTEFVPGAGPTEQELFEECTLGLLSARQSTNYRGFRQVTLGPADAAKAAAIMQGLDGLEAPVLDHASHVHLVVGRPYRTPFTLLLTLVGHKPLKSLWTVPLRALKKRFRHVDDIPTIGYLAHLHTGILADAMERAAPLASDGARRAQVFMAPFCGERAQKNRATMSELGKLAGLTPSERSHGWRISLVAQVGTAAASESITLSNGLSRKLSANLLSFRSERIQPGINQEESAPPQYQKRQDMDVPDELTIQAGRAAYNAFAHWAGVDRELSKDLLLLERVDVLTPNGKERLRAMRAMLGGVTDRVIENLPLWAELPTGRLFSKNANRGRKAFALAGQRIYIAGLAKKQIERAGLDWHLAVRATGAACSRSALYCELMGVVNLPSDCDLLAGMCLMAGPVNQNDIGKEFYGIPDILAGAFPDRDCTSLLVWTLKAKTVTDPVGNEEQLLNTKRKGALVDLRPGPHDVVAVRTSAGLRPMRESPLSQERGFGDQGNFVAGIPGNEGAPWPAEKANRAAFET